FPTCRSSDVGNECCDPRQPVLGTAGLLPRCTAGNPTGDRKRTCHTNCQRENPRHSGSPCPGAAGRRHGPRNDKSTGTRMNEKTDDNHDSPKAAVPEPPIQDERAAEEDDARIDAGLPPAREPLEDARHEDPVYGSDRPAPPPPPPRRGVSSAIAWLALLLALLALAGSGYLGWQDRATAADKAGNEAAIASLSGRLDDALASPETSEQAAIAELADSARQGATRIGSLERQIEELSRRNESVYPRLRNLEDAISSLQGVSAGVRETWMLAEAEYYMQIANAQLQLAGNP